MSSAQELFCLLVVLYLIDCVVPLPRSASLLAALGTRALRWHAAADLPGTPTRGLWLAMPLPPFGRIHAIDAPPVVLSPAGWTPRDPVSGAAAGSLRSWNGADGAAIRAAGARLELPGAAPVRLSHQGAALWAERLRGLCAASEAERPAQIAALIDGWFDLSVARRLEARWRRVSFAPRCWCTAMFALLFVVGPLFLLDRDLRPTWPYLAGALVALWTAIIWSTLRAASVLKREHAVRPRGVGVALCSPLSAIRACDALGKDLFAGMHPLTAAAAASAPETYAEHARAVWGAAVHRPSSAGAGAAEDAGRAQAWFDAELRRRVERLLAETQLDSAMLLAPPPPEDSSCVCWCPRCRGQYVRAMEMCPRCAVQLRCFASATHAGAPDPGIHARTRTGAD